MVRQTDRQTDKLIYFLILYPQQMVYRRRPQYKKKQAIRRRRMMKGKKSAYQGKVKYAGIKYFKESLSGVDVQMPVVGGVVANLGIKLTASLNDISTVAQFQATNTRNALKALFGRYCITGVKYVFIPRYTSADSTTRAADRVLYAINRDPTDGGPNSEDDLITQNDCKFTNSSRKFSIYVKHPQPQIFSTSGTGVRTPNQAPNPTGGAAPVSNQIVALPAQKRWTWLPTRVIDNNQADPLASDQCPDHFGADVYITTNNPTLTESYVNYTMYKTVYFAFKEQE